MKIKSNKQIANNSLVITILSNYINIWKVYSHTLPKIFYFYLIFRINKAFFINSIFHWRSRFCGIFPPSALSKIITVRTPYLKDGHLDLKDGYHTWRMDTILEGWTPYLTDGHSIWQMNILFSWIVYMFNILF